MASPQLEDGYTRIANELLEAKAKARFSAAEHSVLDVVLRECYGRNGGQKECFLSFADISTKTSLPSSTTAWAITRLCRRNVLIRDRHTYPPKTSVQKDYERWKPQEIVGKKATRNCDESHKNLRPLPQEIGVSKKKEEKKKVRAGKQHADPRFQPLVDHYLKRTQEITGTKPFDPADGKNLQGLLARNPETPLAEITRWLDNAFGSTEIYPLRPGFRMTEFCRHYAKYTRGPLLKGNHRGNGLGSKGGSLTQEELHRLTEGKHEGQSVPA